MSYVGEEKVSSVKKNFSQHLCSSIPCIIGKGTRISRAHKMGGTAMPRLFGVNSVEYCVGRYTDGFLDSKWQVFLCCFLMCYVGEEKVPSVKENF